MKKSLVLNRVEKTPIGCNLFNKVDRYKRSQLRNERFTLKKIK